MMMCVRNWDAIDLRFGDLTIEVKASDLSQTWSLLAPKHRVSAYPGRSEHGLLTPATESSTTRLSELQMCTCSTYTSRFRHGTDEKGKPRANW